MAKKSFYLLLIFTFFSCSTGKKALQKGDYFEAVTKAIVRLKHSPENKNALQVLQDGYPQTLDWSQEELDLALTSNTPFKWERAILIMEKINLLAENIRSTPAARKIIRNPKTYLSEMNMALENAAEERYNKGEEELKRGTRESGRSAYTHFQKANNFVKGYKQVDSKLTEAREMATAVIILDAVPVTVIKYQLTSDFFYSKVFEYIYANYGEKSLVAVYTPAQHKNSGLKYYDSYIKLDFFDFAIGNTHHSEKEETVENKVKIESKDTTKVEYATYKAKLKTFTDKASSQGSLSVRITETPGNRLIINDVIPGSFTWINEYAIFVGDKEALTKAQLELTRQKAAPLPSNQDMFIEFTKPIYNQLISKLNNYLNRFK